MLLLLLFLFICVIAVAFVNGVGGREKQEREQTAYGRIGFSSSNNNKQASKRKQLSFV